MYSRVAICKICQRRVLDEQLSMSTYGHEDKCLYCLITYLEAEILDMTRKRDDLFFSFQILEFSYSEVHSAYESAVADNNAKCKELDILKTDLLNYEKLFYVNPNKLIG